MIFMFDIPIKNMVSFFFYSYVKLPEASDGFSHWEVPHWKNQGFLISGNTGKKLEFSQN